MSEVKVEFLLDDADATRLAALAKNQGCSGALLAKEALLKALDDDLPQGKPDEAGVDNLQVKLTKTPAGDYGWEITTAQQDWPIDQQALVEQIKQLDIQLGDLFDHKQAPLSKSIKLTRNAKGDYQWDISLWGSQEELVNFLSTIMFADEELYEKYCAARKMPSDE